MRDRGAIGALGLGAFDVDVDPLMVAGDVGEVVDPLLADLQPVTDTEFASDQCLRVVDGGDDLHC